MKNLCVIINSILAIICFVLTFSIHWSFIIVSVFLIGLNQKLLFPKIKT
ncbi:MAG: hypothetical protein PHF09_02290 [Candidatus Nanoarchaeia archaeon]|nr:hypothetical protein [Candidatus Nanoarchaeia archaeon]